jgi:arylsulfatase A
VLELCGIAEPRTLSLDGISLVPLLEGKSEGWPERRIFTVQSRGGQLQSASGAVRTERHRFVTDGQRFELYDMATDPGQRKDIAAENTSLVETLRSAYDGWLKAVTQNGIERLPIPVGYPQARIVELPAPESYFSGNLRFKGGQGWANDWITGWQRIEDSVSWEIDVAQPGRFEVSLLFTCPKRDVGSRIRVEAAAQAVEGVVGQAHDPEPVASPDRVPRGEVYEKVWAPLTLGALDLPAGRSRLNVKALSKPGESVMELKAVRLSRLD